MLEDPREETLADELVRRAVEVLAAARDARVSRGGVVRAGDRQAPLFLEELTHGIEELRVRHEPRARLPSSNTKSRREIPTWGPARPTPGASRIVSPCRRRARGAAGPNSLTGAAGSRRTGSPSVRMRRITTAPLASLQVRLRLDAVDGAVRRGSRSRVPSTGTGRGRGRASIPSAPRARRRAGSRDRTDPTPPPARRRP